jgi:5-methylcytosine-specific restriction endonuclease McrA
MLTITCTRCGAELPATREFFYPHPNSKHGLRARCKTCVAIANLEYRQSHARELAERARERRLAHPGLEAERHRRNYLANRERFAERDARYYREHREEKLAYQRAYRATHREKRAEDMRRWQAEHPEMVAANSRRRSARKRNAGGDHSADDVAAQYLRQHGHCYWCGEKVGRGYHVDHVIPLALGGSNGPENLVVACPACNQSKSAKHPMDFAGVLF